MRQQLSALFVLLRPRFMVFLLLLPVMGWAWAHWDRALDMRGGTQLLWVLLSWSLLHAGTMWLNAVLDRDDGEVLLGRAVEPPVIATPAAYSMLIACVPVGFHGSTVAGLCALAAAVLAVLYSHPRTAWKGHIVFGPLVNVVGYGFLSPLAGWSVVGVSVNPRTAVACALFFVGMFSPYFAAQAFQAKEDKDRGYQTAIVLLGPSRTLFLSRVAMWVVMGGGALLAGIGWVPRVCLCAVPLGLWVDAHLRRWALLPDGGSAAWALVYARRVMLSAIVLVGLCTGEYVRESLAGEPVAGLGTVGGHPSDRPVLPPYLLRRWERKHRLRS